MKNFKKKFVLVNLLYRLGNCYSPINCTITFTLPALYRISHWTKIFRVMVLLFCLINIKAKGQSDNCSTATLLSVNPTCVPVSGTTAGATQSMPACAGIVDADVWYRFVATNSYSEITVHPTDVNLDPVVEFFSGTCGSPTSLYCMDDGFAGDDEVINAIGLTVGATYYIRVYDYFANLNANTFEICIKGSSSPLPSNDEPCNAIPLPPVTSGCNYLMFTTTGATASAGVPTPSNCVGGSSPYHGGWGVSSKDVWFSVVVPSNGKLVIAAKPTGVGITDGVIALYSGTCSALNQIECYDDYSHPYPVITSTQPMIIRSGLTPGDVLFIRFWGYGSSVGTFGICVSSPTNDDCSNSLYICDINGYKGTTSGAYLPDFPDNMDGTWPVGNSPGSYAEAGVTYNVIGHGPFGWGQNPNIGDVQINNNSWIRFTAANSTATLTATVSDCWKTTPLGIQMQIFSANNCANFDTVSNFSESTTTLTITAHNLTIGNDYYLMIDGWGGDICNYTIQATGGIVFTNITASSNDICLGETFTLSGPNGATAYNWLHSGETSQTVSVTPTLPGDYYYTLFVYGVCGAIQTLFDTVHVNPLPTVNCSNNISIPNGTCTTLNANVSGGSGSYSYIWSPSGSLVSNNIQNPTTTNLSVSTLFNVTVTDNISGCRQTNQITVTITGGPLIINTLVYPSSICFGQSSQLNALSGGGSGTYTYSWVSNPAGFTSNSSNPTVYPYTNTTYTVSVSDGFSTVSSSATVIVNLLPNADAGNNISICAGSCGNLNAIGGSTYLWYPPTGLSANNIPNPLASPSSTTTYVVMVTNSNFCTATDNITITVNPLPLADAGNDKTICEADTIVLNASGGNQYSWNTGNYTPSINVKPNVTTTYTVTVTNSNNCSSFDNVVVFVNPLPLANAGTDSIICTGDSITLSALGGMAYLWSTGDNSQTIIVYPYNTNTYYVTVTGANGCSATDDVVVATKQTPYIQLTYEPSDDFIYIGQLFTVNANPSTYPLYNFYIDSILVQSGQSNTYSSEDLINKQTIYVVAIENGCSSLIDSIDVNVKPIPNAFTPANNDNINDIFLKGLNIKIVNRWGQKMYEGKNGWDGKYNGQYVSKGTYYYVVMFTDKNSIANELKGSVSVIN